MKRIALVLAAAGCLAAADWLTFGGDPQRTGWAREEKKLSGENVERLRVRWKTKLDNAPKELTALTAPLVSEGVKTPDGVKNIVLVAGSSDRVFAIDADSGGLLWDKTFRIEGTPKQKPDWLCPLGLNATPVIDKQSLTLYAIASDGKLHALAIVDGEDRFPPAPFVPPFSKNWSLNLADGVVYTIISQGCNGALSGVWAMDVADPRHTVRHFDASNTGGAGAWGRAGAAITSSGLVYTETGDGPYDTARGRYPDTFVALSPRDLRLVDFYTPANREWITKKDLDMGCISPVVFPFRGRELVAGGGKEGVLFLLDAASPGGRDHRTPLFRSPLYVNEEAHFAARGFWGALSTWEDEQGVRWLYAPAWGPQAAGSPEFPATDGEAPNGSIMAFRVEAKNGRPVLAPAWRSRDLAVPEPAVIANGLVFALSTGENTTQVGANGRILSTRERIDGTTGHAVLYAFDARSGKELYSSGGAIATWTHFSGLAVSGGRVYVVTRDSTVYAFGL